MKKHYIVVASMENKIKNEIENCVVAQVLPCYNCTILKKGEEYGSIFELWDLLDGLSLQQQANTLVIFDPGIYKNIPEEISNRPKSTNYWHTVCTEELFPWYELVLRYPLVTPIFLTFKEKALFGGFKADPFCYINLQADIKKQLQDNISRFLYGFHTWFDPFGLRDMWRHKILERIFEHIEDKNNSQTKRVFCVEDEMDYALLNSYTAYKYGANVWLVESFETLCWCETKAAQDDIVLRDIDLRFRDFRDNQSRTRARLGEQDGIFEEVKTKIFISSYVKDKNSQSITKPIESMYKVAEACQLEKKRTLKNRYHASGQGNHSSPYLNMQLAQHLIQAARRSGDSTAEKIFRALHYTEAYMILNYMAETTSMEILKEIHMSELDITLSFIGIGKNQSIKNRKKDIEEDIDQLLDDKEKNKMKESFLISFWNSAKTIYLNHEQFSAAEDANLETMKRLPWW